MDVKDSLIKYYVLVVGVMKNLLIDFLKVLFLWYIWDLKISGKLQQDNII